MDRDERGQPLSRTVVCPECGARLRVLADEFAYCSSCDWDEGAEMLAENDPGAEMDYAEIAQGEDR